MFYNSLSTKYIPLSNIMGAPYESFAFRKVKDCYKSYTFDEFVKGVPCFFKKESNNSKCINAKSYNNIFSSFNINLKISNEINTLNLKNLAQICNLCQQIE
jgi:RNase H-fold protein (predicted Holliday junction resolvase)